MITQKCAEGAVDAWHPVAAQPLVSPCILADLKFCGKKFTFFYDDSFLLLTKKSQFEILITRKMNEWKVHKKYHSQIVGSLEVFLPLLVVLITGLIMFRKN